MIRIVSGVLVFKAYPAVIVRKRPVILSAVQMAVAASGLGKKSFTRVSRLVAILRNADRAKAINVMLRMYVGMFLQHDLRVT
jgi:hypothetical protein